MFCFFLSRGRLFLSVCSGNIRGKCGSYGSDRGEREGISDTAAIRANRPENEGASRRHSFGSRRQCWQNRPRVLFSPTSPSAGLYSLLPHPLSPSLFSPLFPFALHLPCRCFFFPSGSPSIGPGSDLGRASRLGARSPRTVFGEAERDGARPNSRERRERGRGLGKTGPEIGRGRCHGNLCACFW